MRLGIYIGSFNPPHLGHKKVINYLIDENYVDKVLVIPTQNYWNKNNLVSLEHRINMLKFYENENIKIDTENNNYNYTYELMRVLQSKYPLDELYLVLGADNIIEFDKWKNYEELLKYKIIVMNRGNININKYVKKYNSDNFIVLDDFDSINISSTIIRNEKNSRYLDKKVLKYMIKMNLYK